MLDSNFDTGKPETANCGNRGDKFESSVSKLSAKTKTEKQQNISGRVAEAEPPSPGVSHGGEGGGELP